MVCSGYGESVGKKFNADGSVRRFPGNTMVCILDPATSVYERAREERDNLRKLCGRILSVLPDESLHMTAIEGVCDQVRTPSHWTSKIPLDAPLKKVDDFFEETWHRLPPLGEVSMTFDHLWLEFGAAIALHPATDADEKRIRTWRDRVGEALGLHFPGHEDYMFHISLAYGILQPAEEERKIFETEKERFDEECLLHPFTFTVPQPSLTFFDDMFFFNTCRIPR